MASTSSCARDAETRPCAYADSLGYRCCRRGSGAASLCRVHDRLRYSLPLPPLDDAGPDPADAAPEAAPAERKT